jgi:hypothetical protein
MLCLLSDTARDLIFCVLTTPELFLFVKKTARLAQTLERF